MPNSQRDREIAIAQGAGKAKRAAGNAVHGLTYTEVLADFHRLKSDDARAAFARTWLAKSSEALNETWSVVYALLKIVEEKELYKKESSLNNSKTYNSFQEFFEDTLKRPFEEWARLEADYNYISQYCLELLNSFQPNKLNIATYEELKYHIDILTREIKKLRQENETLKKSSRDEFDEIGFWLLDNNFDRSRFSDFGITEEATKIESIAWAFYQKLAQKYHPDNGGTHMQLLNVDRLYDQMMVLVEMNEGLGK